MEFTRGPIALRRSLLTIPMTSTITPITPVWTEKGAVYKSQMRSDDELQDFFEEELFIYNQFIDEDDTEAQQVVATSTPNSGYTFVTHEAHHLFVPVPVNVMEQTCRPYAAPTTILFDMAAPDETSKELALLALFSPEEMPALFMSPVKEITEHSPTPKLLDTSDLKPQPLRATSPVHNSICHTQGFDPYDNFEIRKSAFDYTYKRQGRSMKLPPRIFKDPEVNQLAVEEFNTVNGQGKAENCKTIHVRSAEGPHKQEVEYGRVLREITSHTFLPGVEHLVNVEACPAFITYDSGIEALRPATAGFFGDDLHGGDKIGAAMRLGAKSLSSENSTAWGLSIQSPTAQSLLDLIDDLVNSDSSVEDIANSPNAAPLVQKKFSNFVSKPWYNPYQQPLHYGEKAGWGTIHYLVNSKYVNYIALTPLDAQASIKETIHQNVTMQRSIKEVPCLSPVFDTANFKYPSNIALDQFLDYSNNTSSIVCKHSDAADDVSDKLNDEANDLFVASPTELAYYDADTQQSIMYTVINQLLMNQETDEVVPRVHRADRDFDDDLFDLVDSILEIGELPASDNDTGLGLLSPHGDDFEAFDFEFNGVHCRTALNPPANAMQHSLGSLSSYSLAKQRQSKNRLQLTVNTQLDAIVEISSEDDKAPPSSSSSEASNGFADRRGFVRTMSARCIDFLDDGESDGDLDVPESVDPSYASESESLEPRPTPPTVSHVRELFEDPIWYSQPDLFLSFPKTPLDSHTLSLGECILDVEILESIEVEIVQLIAYIFQCLNGGRLSEAQVLGGDLQWALSALADTFPSLRLMARLGTTVETLLKRNAASGT
jgi:hypothetical protein